MKIEAYEIFKTKRGGGWTLRTFYMSKDKDGNPKERSRDTYYSRLESCLKALVDTAAGGCETACELSSLLSNVHAFIDEIVRSEGFSRPPSKRIRTNIGGPKMGSDFKVWLTQEFQGMEEVIMEDGKTCTREVWKTIHRGGKQAMA